MYFKGLTFVLAKYTQWLGSPLPGFFPKAKTKQLSQDYESTTQAIQSFLDLFNVC